MTSSVDQDPEKWLEEHFLKGYEETDFEYQVEGDLDGEHPAGPL